MNAQKPGTTIKLKKRGFVMPKKLGTEIIISKFGRSSTNNFSPSSRSFNHATSVAHNITPYQVFLICSSKKLGKLYQLKNLINQHQFSESLEVLEKSGISGDFALFIIQNIQTLEVA